MKTTFFDLTILERDTKGDLIYFVEALRLFSNKKLIPRRAWQRYKPLKSMKIGTSFLLNPEPLFADKVDVSYKVQNIKLAGRRDYTAFKLLGTKHLELSYFPDINIQIIQHNPLLHISNGNIYFKYEETTKWH